MTPMQEQYNRIKQEHPHDVVLFRLGDFYEAFDKDAHTISQVLGITLTGRGKDENRMAMAGIPHHALDNYLPKLVAAGLKVVLVDQLTAPKPGELVERGISKIFTAGTLTLENTLQDNRNNFIASVYRLEAKQEIWGVAICDISTGQLQVWQAAGLASIMQELQRLLPAELICTESEAMAISELTATVTIRPTADFEFDSNYQLLLKQFGTTNLKGFGVEEMPSAISALGALIKYIKECQRTDLEHLKQLSIYPTSGYMLLDAHTIRNLELVYPSSGNDLKATVYATINDCQTSMGKRKLYEWLLRPLTDEKRLQQRWDAVAVFHQDLSLNSKLRETLAEIGDIERVVGRIGTGSANARDLLAIAQGLTQAEQVVELLKAESRTDLLKSLSQEIKTNLQPQLQSLIAQSINPEAPAGLLEGGIIQSGYNSEVDELRSLKTGGRDNLAGIQAREAERTGISSLKVSYNKVFGYYIEITHSHKDKVPADYIRKQTLTNAERYITQELKEWEEKILGAEEKLVQLEYKLFSEIRDQVAGKARELLAVAAALAQLDVLSNFAHLARQYRYTQPTISKSNKISISQGRHPVVERLQDQFTANDSEFSTSSQIIILTGPNMSGKSTYIRQVALLVLLAQIGSFVPATSMEFQLVDRIFTRVGASDNLARGESTFMVEMNETANILNNATKDSLIILDEVGRGTSTYDGVAIAWAVVEYIAEHIGANTLFATHYHELIELEQKYKQVKNYNVAVLEDGEQILFQHKIIPGATSKSYGVHVAQMAGVPGDVIKRAENILQRFENGSDAPALKPKKDSASSPKQPKRLAPGQLDLL